MVVFDRKRSEAAHAEEDEDRNSLLGFSAPEAQHRNAEILCRPPEFGERLDRARSKTRQNAANRQRKRGNSCSCSMRFVAACFKQPRVISV